MQFRERLHERYPTFLGVMLLAAVAAYAASWIQRATLPDLSLGSYSLIPSAMLAFLAVAGVARAVRGLGTVALFIAMSVAATLLAEGAGTTAILFTVLILPADAAGAATTAIAFSLAALSTYALLVWAIWRWARRRG